MQNVKRICIIRRIIFTYATYEYINNTLYKPDRIWRKQVLPFLECLSFYLRDHASISDFISTCTATVKCIDKMSLKFQNGGARGSANKNGWCNIVI